MEKQAHPIHDGISPIIVPEAGEAEQFQLLWDMLVPPAGQAKTAQGELIRIVGRIQHELLDNGGMNWDDEYRCMLCTFPQYLQLGTAFNEENQKAAELLVGLILADGDAGRINGFFCSALCACAVAWVQQNPTVLPPLKAEYTR